MSVHLLPIPGLLQRLVTRWQAEYTLDEGRVYLTLRKAGDAHAASVADVTDLLLDAEDGAQAAFDVTEIVIEELHP